MLRFALQDPDLEGGHPEPLMGGGGGGGGKGTGVGGGLRKKTVWALRASVWSKNKRGA